MLMHGGRHQAATQRSESDKWDVEPSLKWHEKLRFVEAWTKWGKCRSQALTCRTVKTVTKTITNTEQIATPTSATNATGDLIWSLELAPPSTVPSISAASPLNKFPSSASCDNCFSAAMRRFPAGEELMQSPVKNKHTWVSVFGDESVTMGI